MGEEWFDDYWKNYGKITVRISSKDKAGRETEKDVKITDLRSYLRYRGKSDEWISERLNNKPKNSPARANP